MAEKVTSLSGGHTKRPPQFYRNATPPSHRPRLSGNLCSVRTQHAAADLVALDRLEQRAEIAFAEPVIALALDDLEKNRADDGFGEDLQQQPLPVSPLSVSWRAIDQDLIAAQ